MKIRLGYACMSKTIDITTSSTITYTNYIKDKDTNKIDNIIIKNLTNLSELIDYNIRNDITFFRLSSAIVPLATHNEVEFDYIDKFAHYYEVVASKIKNMRIDMHPDQFTVLNSTKEEVITRSIQNLEYHYKVLDALGIKDKILVLHVGSSVFGKKQSIARFINEFNKLPKHLQKCIALENDDKVYDAFDVLLMCEKLNIPMILDYHHHICNHEEFDITKILKRILSTWNNTNLIPKMHYSSSKSKLKKEFRAHHDYINALEFIQFLEVIKKFDTDIDVMIEAKAKDEAVFKLLRELKYYRYNVQNTTIIL